jgi:amino acid transporter
MTGKYILSEKAKNGQKAIFIIFSFIYALLIIFGLTTNQIFYFYIVLVGAFLFSPVYLYTLNFSDIYIKDDFFYFNRFLKKEVKIPISKFEKIVPMQTLLWTFSSPDFTIILKDKKKFHFRTLKKQEFLSVNRKPTAEKLTSEIKALLE